MVTSQNGYTAYDNTSHFVRGEAAGFKFWAFNDDVRVIFEDLIYQFDRDIERIAGKILDDWSYANRLVRGSTKTVSNHGSATAIDLNATKHPRGVHNTFTKAQVAAIKKLVDSYDGVIRWGGTYTTTVDDMHFEINAGKAAVKKVADKIREKNVFTKEDKAWISAEIRRQAEAAAHKAVVDVLTKEKIVPNKPVNEGDPVADNWTVAGVLAAADLKADRTAAARAAAVKE